MSVVARPTGKFIAALGNNIGLSESDSTARILRLVQENFQELQDPAVNSLSATVLDAFGKSRLPLAATQIEQFVSDFQDNVTVLSENPEDPVHRARYLVRASLALPKDKQFSQRLLESALSTLDEMQARARDAARDFSESLPRKLRAAGAPELLEQLFNAATIASEATARLVVAGNPSVLNDNEKYSRRLVAMTEAAALLTEKMEEFANLNSESGDVRENEFLVESGESFHEAFERTMKSGANGIGGVSTGDLLKLIAMISVSQLLQMIIGGVWSTIVAFDEIVNGFLRTRAEEALALASVNLEFYTRVTASKIKFWEKFWDGYVYLSGAKLEWVTPYALRPLAFVAQLMEGATDFVDSLNLGGSGLYGWIGTAVLILFSYTLFDWVYNTGIPALQRIRNPEQPRIGQPASRSITDQLTPSTPLPPDPGTPKGDVDPGDSGDEAPAMGSVRFRLRQQQSRTRGRSPGRR